MKKRREGFSGQKLVVVSKEMRQQLREDVLCRHLYFTDIGLFPKAEEHLVVRPRGCSEYVILFCFSGNGWCEIDGQRREINAGEYVVLPPSIRHSYGSKDKSYWGKGWIHFAGSSVEDFLSKLNPEGFGQPHSFRLHKDWFNQFTAMIDSLSYDLSFQNVAYSCTKLWSSFAALIFPPRAGVVSSSKDGLEKSLQYMHDNIKGIISLEDLATVAGLSVSRYCVLFKKRTGTSAKNYLNQLKVQEACRLLSMTDWSVKDIAHELSFDDQYYFSRLFKQKIGVSPSGYRQKNIY